MGMKHLDAEVSRSMDIMTRIDGPHTRSVVEAAITRLPEESLQQQAEQLAEYLRKQQKDIDRREAELNARSAQFDALVRQVKTTMLQEQAELDQKQKQLDDLELELEDKRKQAARVFDELCRREQAIRQRESALNSL